MTILIVGTLFLLWSLFSWSHLNSTHSHFNFWAGFGEQVAKNHHLFVAITKHTVKGGLNGIAFYRHAEIGMK